MRAEDVLELYTMLLNHGVQIWIDGGWGLMHSSNDRPVRIKILMRSSCSMTSRHSPPCSADAASS